MFSLTMKTHKPSRSLHPPATVKSLENYLLIPSMARQTLTTNVEGISAPEQQQRKYFYERFAAEKFCRQRKRFFHDLRVASTTLFWRETLPSKMRRRLSEEPKTLNRNFAVDWGFSRSLWWNCRDFSPKVRKFSEATWNNVFLMGLITGEQQASNSIADVRPTGATRRRKGSSDPPSLRENPISCLWVCWIRQKTRFRLDCGHVSWIQLLWLLIKSSPWTKSI